MTLWGALDCARCGWHRTALVHGSARDCHRAMIALGSSCARPSEHHRYRPAILALAWWGL